MNIPTKTLQSGFTLPVLGLGTWNIGGSFEKNPNNNDEADILSIQKTINAGIIHIDTAEMYAEGYTEELIGKAIRRYNRKKLFITTKVSPEHLEYKAVLQSAYNSLKRLKTDYIDLYLIHHPNPFISLKETMRAFNKLKDEKIIRFIGVSNFSIKNFDEAQFHTHYQIVSNQVHYNLVSRAPQYSGLLNYCQKNDIMLISWQPLQKGQLVKQKNPLMQKLCKKYHKTPAQIALRWLIEQQNVVVITKMSNPIHMQENLGAIGWDIDKSDIACLTSHYPYQQKKTPSFSGIRSMIKRMIQKVI